MRMLPLDKKSVERFLIIGVCSIAIILRIGLVAVNREANDNHLSVIHMIMDEGR
jgi:hypothetical protein